MADFNTRFDYQFPSSPISNSNMNDLGAFVKLSQGMDKIRRNYNRSLIDSAFPSPGTAQGSHEGSQSNTPTKEQY